MRGRQMVDLDGDCHAWNQRTGAGKEDGHRKVAVKLVEAAGQPVRPFRVGLDYAFILLPGCGACYPAGKALDPSARPAIRFGASMSLYRAGLRLALFLPLGVAMPVVAGNRVRRCEPRYHSALSSRGDHIDRTRVRKSSTVRTTCLAWLIELRFASANRQADARLAASTDPRSQAAKPRRGAGENDAAPLSELGLRLLHLKA